MKSKPGFIISPNAIKKAGSLSTTQLKNCKQLRFLMFARIYAIVPS